MAGKRLRTSRGPGRAGDPGDEPRSPGGGHRRWLEALPDELIRTRPVLSDGYAGALLVHGEIEGVEGRLADAEQWLVMAAEARDWRASGRPRWSSWTRRLPHLPAAIAIHRAGLARIRGRRRRQRWPTHGGALELLDEDEHLGQGAPPPCWASPTGRRGPRGREPRLYLEAIASLEKAGHIADLLGLTHHARRHADRPRWSDDAKRRLERGLRDRDPPGRPALRGTADMHVGSARSPASATTSVPHRRICDKPGTGRGERSTAEPLSLARRPGRGSGRREGDLTGPSSFSTRRNDATTATSRRMSARSLP